MKSDEIRAALERIEERQAAYETVAMRILQTLQGMTEMLAATYKAGEDVAAIVEALNESTAALQELPITLGEAIEERVHAALVGEDDDTPEQDDEFPEQRQTDPAC